MILQSISRNSRIAERQGRQKQRNRQQQYYYSNSQFSLLLSLLLLSSSSLLLLVFHVGVVSSYDNNNYWYNETSSIRKSKQRQSRQSNRRLMDYVLGATNKEEELVLLKQSVAKIASDKIHKEKIRVLLSGIQEDGKTKFTPVNQTAIIHIGPQRTGLNIIQEYMLYEEIQDSLEEDYYKKVPDKNDMSAYGFTRCFDYDDIKRYKPSSTDTIDYTCYTDVIRDTIQIARPYTPDLFHKSNNLIYTSDTLPEPECNIRELYTFFTSHWQNVYIVGYYRRWFRWIVSLHHETMKYHTIPTRTPLHIVLDNQHHLINNVFNMYYYYGTMKRYEKYFNTNNQNNNHIIKHYHLNHLNKPNVVEHFFCTVLPEAPTVCNAAKEHLRTEGLPKRKDDVYTIYQELAYYAYEMNLINQDIIISLGNEKWINELAHVVKYRQLYILNKKENYYDFGNMNSILCPQQSSIDLLWDLTIKVEQEYFPQYVPTVGSDKQYNEIYIEFQQYINKKAFCHIDAKIILKDSTDNWKEFFQSLTLDTIEQMKKSSKKL